MNDTELHVAVTHFEKNIVNHFRLIVQISQVNDF